MSEVRNVTVDLVSCPFCKEPDFDLIGLKMHISRGHCDGWDATPDDDEEPEDEGEFDPYEAAGESRFGLPGGGKTL